MSPAESNTGSGSPRQWSADELADLLGTHRPTAEQRAVIEAPLRPTVVVAGAGSGKTETMAARVVWLVANGHVAPQDVLGLTFTRKAAMELAARLADKLSALREAGVPVAADRDPADPDVLDDAAFDLPTVSTYHAYAGRLVSEHGLRLGVEPDARLLSEAASWQLAHEVVLRHDADMSAMDLAESTVVRAVLNLSGELSEHLVDPDEVSVWLDRVGERLSGLPGRDGQRPKVAGRRTAALLARQGLIPPLVVAYRRAKAEQGALDFGDQMALAATLARDVPQVAAAEQVRYRAVLLDEFQDTSEAQMVLMTSLFGGADLAITAVGDPHQSIYGWRGASATTLSRFPREFAVADRSADVLHLSTSWRNDERILAAANAVAGPLQEVTEIPVRTLDARPGAGAGSVEVARFGDHVTEAEEVAGWIAEHWGRPEGRSAAVLCRARAQFPTVVDALRRRGLPVEVVGLGGLLDTPEILDLVAVLWLTQEPTRGDQAMRVLTGPLCRVGPADIDVLWAWARSLAGRDARAAGREHAAVLAEAIDLLPPPGWRDGVAHPLTEEARSRLTWLGGVIARLRGLTGLPLPDLVLEAERLIGVDLEVAADPDLHPTWGRAQLDALVEVAATFAAGAARVSLGAFLQWLDAAREHERGLEATEVPELAEISVDAAAVQVLTVHAAKGLEWDLVAIPGLVEGTFPSITVRATATDGGWSIGPPRDRGWLSGIGRLPTPLRGDRQGRPDLPWLSVPDTHDLDDRLAQLALDGGAFAIAEERRLAYVAFTRARHRMLLTAPVWSTGKTPRVTSRFLEEARSATDAHAQVQGWAPMPDPDDAEQLQNPRLLEETVMPWPLEPGGRRVVARDLVTALLATPAPAGQDGAAQAERDGHPMARRWADLVRVLLAERAERARLTSPDLPAHLSTSTVVELADDPARFRAGLRRPLPRPPAPQARLGSAFHAWIEHHYAAPALVEMDELFALPSDGGPGQDLTLLQRNFLDSEWANRSPVDVEIPVETSIAGRSVRGRIDAVFEDPDGGVTIVDWKTGRPGSRDQQRVRSLQLGIYRVAYARLTGRSVDEVRAAFFHAATGETVRPTLVDEADLEDLMARLAAAKPPEPG
ncbi:ATP-dependent helicase [Ornithinimicrobium sp. Y1694]|uniref:ATP-dependent helicase n=1 Tax=Ornithinimicrobium sp. Y1694 TaxID=3418590 RepID=UPI003CFA97B9